MRWVCVRVCRGERTSRPLGRKPSSPHVEARRDRAFALGVDASIKQQHVVHTENTTVGGAFTPGTAGLADFTLRVMGVGGSSPDIHHPQHL